MLSFDRSWLARPVLLALGCGSLLGFGGCGGAATGELGGSIDGDGDGDGGTAGTAGGTGGSGAGRVGAGGTGVGGSGGGSSGGGSSGGGSSGNAGTSAGGVGGFGGVAGFGGTGGSFATGGIGGFSGSTGAAGSASTSVCVDLSSGLSGLPSQAFPASDGMVEEYCGPGFEDRVNQAICLPSPGPGQSCTSFYPDYLITQLYQCGGQSSANFLCGPHQPLPDERGCRGDECCYVLVGDCN